MFQLHALLWVAMTTGQSVRFVRKVPLSKARGRWRNHAELWKCSELWQAPPTSCRRPAMTRFWRFLHWASWWSFWLQRISHTRFERSLFYSSTSLLTIITVFQTYLYNVHALSIITFQRKADSFIVLCSRFRINAYNHVHVRKYIPTRQCKFTQSCQ